MLQFRGWPVGTMCSFLFDVWVAIEPDWDFGEFDRDRPHAYPRRAQSYDAVVHRQLGPDPHAWSNWQWNSIAGRNQAGHRMRDLLMGEIVPTVLMMLNRPPSSRRTQGCARLGC